MDPRLHGAGRPSRPIAGQRQVLGASLTNCIDLINALINVLFSLDNKDTINIKPTTISCIIRYLDKSGSLLWRISNNGYIFFDLFCANLSK